MLTCPLTSCVPTQGGRRSHGAQADAWLSAFPVGCEISRIVNSHHENSNPGFSLSRRRRQIPARNLSEEERPIATVIYLFGGPVSCKVRRSAVAHGGCHAGFLSPNFLMRETRVLGLILSNSAAPPGP